MSDCGGFEAEHMTAPDVLEQADAAATEAWRRWGDHWAVCSPESQAGTPYWDRVRACSTGGTRHQRRKPHPQPRSVLRRWT